MKTILLLAVFASLAFAQSVTVGGTTTTGGQTANATLALTWQPKLTLALSCPSITQVSGTVQTCTATINTPAPAGGAVVTLNSADPTKFTVPASVVVAAGATSATFPVTAL